MALKYVTDIDLNKNELQNAVIQNVSGSPSSPKEGQIWLNTTDNKLYFFDGTNNIPLPSTNISGNAATATALQTARAIDGVNFDGSAGIIHYGTCNTPVTSMTKEVSCTGFTLVTGARIIVKFTNQLSIPSAATMALNVNQTGAVDVYYRGSVLRPFSNQGNRVIEFVYDGSHFEVIGDVYESGSSTFLSDGTDTVDRVWQPKILHDYIASVLGNLDALRFKGTIGTGGDVTTLPTTGVQVGDTYRVITAGTYAGETCEVGDLIIATATTPTWTVAQTNIEGAITAVEAAQGTPLSTSKSGATVTITHSDTAVTPGAYGDEQNKTPSWGGTFKVTSGVVNQTGHMTGFAEHTVKIPQSTATQSTIGLMSAQDKTKLDSAVANYTATNPSLTSNSTTGVCTWAVTHNLSNQYPSVTIYEVSTGNQVMADVVATSTAECTIKILSSSTITAGTYRVVVQG